MSNQTAIQYHTWRPEPLVRGTFSILSSCLVTMTLCVWSAVHLNIPEHKKESQQFWRKLKWLLIALLAPEFIAFCAFKQRIEASTLQREMEAHFHQTSAPDWRNWCRSAFNGVPEVAAGLWHSLSNSPGRILQKARAVRSSDDDMFMAVDKSHDDETRSNTGQRHAWTLTHSFYAIMGGFAFDTYGEPANFLPGNRRRVTLTYRGIIFLLEHQPPLLPDLAKTTITDKSKASWMIKSFVCLQAMWFCAQCFSRWAQDLSVSLLELNTFAHALCALLIYILWWEKPMDIEEPTLIRGKAMHEIAATMCLGSLRKLGFYPRWNVYPKIAVAREQRPVSQPPNVTDYTGVELPFTASPPSVEGLQSISPNDDGTLDLQPGECAYGIRYVTSIFASGFRLLQWRSLQLRLSAADVKSWQLVNAAMQPSQEHTLSAKIIEEALKPSNHPLVKDRITNSFTIEELEKYGHYKATLLPGLFYGSIHLTAWNHIFRTPVEAILWKLSGFSILFFGPCFLLLDYCIGGHSLALPQVIELAIWSLIYLISLFYVVCRVFLVAESFVDVFHLPDSAFQVPQWSQYFIHIG